MKPQCTGAAPWERLNQRLAELHPAIAPVGPLNNLDATAAFSAAESGSDQRLLAALLDQLQRAFPQAGPRYWSARLWLLTLWQPIYLCVGASDCGLRVDLSTLRQRGTTQGFSAMALGPPLVSDEQHLDLIAHNAAQLSAYAQRCFYSLAAQLRLCRANCLGLVDDTLLAALIASQASSGRAASGLPELALQWLHHSNWAAKGRRRVPQITLHDDQPQVLRRSCCRHHLTGTCPSLYCANCPLLAKAQPTAHKKENQ